VSVYSVPSLMPTQSNLATRQRIPLSMGVHFSSHPLTKRVREAIYLPGIRALGQSPDRRRVPDLTAVGDPLGMTLPLLAFGAGERAYGRGTFLRG
jgi:hypothetical protein